MNESQCHTSTKSKSQKSFFSGSPFFATGAELKQLFVFMALTTRHRWCIEQIKQCFHNEGVDDSAIHGFIRKPNVLNKFNALFSGEGKNVVFIHYQKPTTNGEVRQI